MTVYRCIAPEWLKAKPGIKSVVEGELSWEDISALNEEGYNIYFLPNAPSVYDPAKGPVKGADIDQFQYVFVDMDLKQGSYATKEEFLSVLEECNFKPTFVVDSGNGVHAYWETQDLDAMSFLKIQRRLVRFFRTDEAVAKIYQLMRVPGTYNTKKKGEFKPCTVVLETPNVYTAEQLDRALPAINMQDAEYCQNHYNMTYGNTKHTEINTEIPLKFSQLLKDNAEVKQIWLGNVDDRSEADFRLGHLLLASDFTRDEALSTLVNCPKAMSRAPRHRLNYAQAIVDKIWAFEVEKTASILSLSESVRSILAKGPETLKGTRFPCHKYIDATAHGFRLGQVIGLIAGSGVGKTAMALNMFMGFVKRNPNYVHFFVPLEQPGNEIADRWKTLCDGNTALHDKVHVISNYAEDGSFRHLSFEDLREYINLFQKTTGLKAGCIVIDHIGALRKKGKNGENQDLMDICHSMKAFAVETNTLLVMQSQAPREKAGIGDLELNKDAAYGTVYFESYCDYVITIWQPLKRCYSEESCPTVTAFKFCKIRHKKKHLDSIQEDVPYKLLFDPVTEHMRELNQIEEKAFDYWNTQATNKRKADRKTDLVTYTSIHWTKGEGVEDGKVARTADESGDGSASGVLAG